MSHFQADLVCPEGKATNYIPTPLLMSKRMTYVHRRMAFLHQSMHH